jgi:4,5-dihydroxyphthalate decarboxylase
MALTLRTNLADSPYIMAMKDGRVTSDIVTLDYCGPARSHDGFKAMLQHDAFDAGELAIVTYLQARASGKPYVALPVPILGQLQHHCAGYNSELGHLDPKDIEGKKVGVRAYSQTTGMWIRGVLQHEYGVDLDKVTWMTLEDGHVAGYRDPENCVRLPAGADIAQMMLDGELAAALLSRKDMPKDPRVRTLVPDAPKAAQAWYEREGFVPVNHIFVVHQDLTKKHPDAVREIYRMIAESSALAGDGGAVGASPLGLEANRKGLQAAIDWALEQKILPRRLSVDELFDDLTSSL